MHFIWLSATVEVIFSVETRALQPTVILEMEIRDKDKLLIWESANPNIAFNSPFIKLSQNPNTGTIST